MRGFTLLEILVSIAILGIVMAMIYGAYTFNVETIQWARQNGEIQQKARIILDRMAKDMTSAYIERQSAETSIQLGLKGEDDELDGKEADRIHFTALTHLVLNETSPQTDLCEISYYLEEDTERGGMILYRRDDAVVDDNLGEGSGQMEMAEGIWGLVFTYQDRNGVEHDQWDTSSDRDAGALPSLITVRLTLRDQRGRDLTYMTSVHPELAGFELKQGS